MKRRAVLIQAGGAKGQYPLRGPVADVRSLSTWLQHENGGAWEATEIEVLNNPGVVDVANALARAGGCDYAFVAFSGHGWISRDPRTGRQAQQVVLGSGVSVELGTLRPPTRKYTILCDACRKVEELHINFSEAYERGLKYSKAKGWATRAMFRAWFDAAVAAAGDGGYFLYGCAPDECSYEDPLTGGYFTSSLVDLAAQWADGAQRSGCLLTSHALDLVAPVVSSMTRRHDPPQNPMGGPENRTHGNEFPLAVALV